MYPFRYARARDALAAAQGAERSPTTRYVAGGTSIVDLMKIHVERPTELVDINALPLSQIEERADGLWIGALVKNSDAAHHPLVAERYRAVSEALLSGASPQLRNMASTGGNLLQRTRCPYFRDLGAPCNKREPGSGCSAIGGYNRMHAILGGSEQCIAVHPSDLCVALVALEATVHTQHAKGTRAIPMADFHVLPGAHPERETVLGQGELITHVSLPKTAFFARSRYVKVRDRAAFAFALASAAVALDVQDGQVIAARVAFGGIGTRPWRSPEAEQALVGKPATRATFETAAGAALAAAKPREHNAFKLALARQTLIRALETARGAS